MGEGLTAISDLRDGMRQVDIGGEITSVGAERKVSLSDGRKARVAEASLRDESGEVSLSLWDDEIEKVAKGSLVTLKNGYTSTYRGELKLNIGKYGKLTVTGNKTVPKQDRLLALDADDTRIRRIVDERLVELGLIGVGNRRSP